MGILCDFHSILLLHLQSGTSLTHLISITTVQTPYKKSEMRQTTFCFKCSSSLLRPAISRSLSPRHGASSGCGWRNGLQYGRVTANILNKQSRAAETGWSSSLGVQRGVKSSSP